MTETQVDNLTRFMMAFGSGDVALLKQLVHPDFENIQSRALPYGGTYRGWEGFERFALGLWPSTWTIETFDLVRRFDQADPDPGEESVVLQFHLVGSVTATGERIDTTLLEHWILRDGKLFFSQPYWFEAPAKL